MLVLLAKFDSFTFILTTLLSLVVVYHGWVDFKLWKVYLVFLFVYSFFFFLVLVVVINSLLVYFCYHSCWVSTNGNSIIVESVFQVFHHFEVDPNRLRRVTRLFVFCEHQSFARYFVVVINFNNFVQLSWFYWGWWFLPSVVGVLVFWVGRKNFQLLLGLTRKPYFQSFLFQYFVVVTLVFLTLFLVLTLLTGYYLFYFDPLNSLHYLSCLLEKIHLNLGQPKLAQQFNLQSYQWYYYRHLFVDRQIFFQQLVHFLIVFRAFVGLFGLLYFGVGTFYFTRQRCGETR